MPIDSCDLNGHQQKNNLRSNPCRRARPILVPPTFFRFLPPKRRMRGACARQAAGRAPLRALGEMRYGLADGAEEHLEEEREAGGDSEAPLVRRRLHSKALLG